MIDGITSRPFSAKTLPQMVKSGNKEIEDEVIKSSRALYCLSREDVEREINNWSGMSLGDDTTASGSVEMFPTICSICHKETKVPFKPEPSRPVYCKDCIAKMKAGELKPLRGSMNQIKEDEIKFFKPLSDLGIEFEGKENNSEQERYPERIDKVVDHKPKIFSALKKVFNKNAPPFPKPQTVNKPNPVYVKNDFKNPTPLKVGQAQKPVRDNSALRDILNKTLSENKILEPKKEEPKIEEVKKETPPPISLNELKNSNSILTPNLKDRGANAEDMNKLKNLISETKIETPIPKPEPAPIPTPKQEPTPAHKIEPTPTAPIPESKIEPKTKPKLDAQSDPTIQNKNSKVREVPEDVLRKILE